jgi:hypothetical protein
MVDKTAETIRPTDSPKISQEDGKGAARSHGAPHNKLFLV